MNKVAIMMRIKLAAEALNNEESVGNVVIPRQITIDGENRQAISGDMLKHLHTRNLRLLADETELCEGCKIFSPNKNSSPAEKNENLSESGNRVKNCIIDDVEGFMDPKGSAKRRSPINFSFAIAIEENEYQNLLHTKVDTTDEAGKKKKRISKIPKKTDSNENNNKIVESLLLDESTQSDESKNQNEENKNTQMIFYKPVRSNEYALTVQLELDRIGFDDQKLKYSVDEATQKLRQQKAIMALRNMFLDMEGAMCSTRLPHFINIEGILVKKNNKYQVLSKYSALNDDYKEVNQKISNESITFNNVEEFCDVINSLI